MKTKAWETSKYRDLQKHRETYCKLITHFKEIKSVDNDDVNYLLNKLNQHTDFC